MALSSTLLDPSLTLHSLSASLGLDARLSKGMARLGHSRPTLVQAQSWPLFLTEGKDILLKSRTGSGKTLAYALPLLQKVLKQSTTANTGSIQALILIPTKELAHQVYSVLERLIYYATEEVRLGLVSASKQDSSEYIRQEAMLRDLPNILIGTPAALSRAQKLDFSEVHTFVVDEADLVLSLGYHQDVADIVQRLPKTSQGMLVSATLSEQLMDLKKVVLHSPAIVKLQEDDTHSERAPKLIQFFLNVPKNDKFLVIYVFLKLGLLKGKGLFFCNSVDSAYKLQLMLKRFFIRAAVLNEELPLSSRIHILQSYNSGMMDYLICTDASGMERGMDFYRTSFVINVDMPLSPESYTHRIGRTARGGKKGVALTLVERETENDYHILTEIQESQPKMASIKSRDGIWQANNTDGTSEQAPSGEKQSQPCALDFDLSELEGFRYRVEDVSRAVTKKAIADARAQELSIEICNSERLQGHFKESDLQLLQHTTSGNEHLGQEHLKHIPKYMLPRGMQQVSDLHKKRKRKNKNKNKRDGDAGKRKDNDPLQVYDEAQTPNFDDFFADGEDKKEKAEEDKMVVSTKAGTGKSTSGRNAWKEKHKRGKFSNKRRKSDPKPRRSGV